VIDNGSKDPATLAYLEEIARDSRVRVLPWHEEFNYSQLNNFGVQQAEADFIALLNNDVIVISPDWLEELVSQAMQTGVGAVVPRLLYPDERVQQAGVILGGGPHGVAEVAHKGLRKEDPGYGDRAVLAQELSAVGAACLVVKREIYLEVGGFDDQHLAVAFNDIDFCLKLKERGYRMIYTPFAELYHLEHASRGFENTTGKQERFSREIDFMKKKWGNKLLVDPAYNPNLSLGEELFGLAFPPRITPPWRQDRST
jgi:GT2 family glycosyltransferase